MLQMPTATAIVNIHGSRYLVAGALGQALLLHLPYIPQALAEMLTATEVQTGG